MDDAAQVRLATVLAVGGANWLWEQEARLAHTPAQHRRPCATHVPHAARQHDYAATGLLTAARTRACRAMPDVRTQGLSPTVTHWVRPPRLCGTCSLTCCRCLPCLLTNEAALTPAANPPSDPSLHHSASLDFQGHSNPEPGRSAHPAAPALRCSPRQRAGTDCIRSVRPAKQRCQWQAASPIGFGSTKPLTIAGPGRRACGPYVVQRTGNGSVSAADKAGCLRPPEPCASRDRGHVPCIVVTVCCRLESYLIKAAPQRGAAGPASAPRAQPWGGPPGHTPGHTRMARGSSRISRQGRPRSAHRHLPRARLSQSRPPRQGRPAGAALRANAA